MQLLAVVDAADKLAGKQQRGCSQLAAEVAEYRWTLQKDRELQMGWGLVHHRHGVGRLCRLHHRINCSV